MTIVTKLFGGLGNQLFQYATARQLGLHLDRPVLADLSWFRNIQDGETPRVPLLSHFHLPVSFVHSDGDPEHLAEPAANLWQAIRRPVRTINEKQPFRFDKRLQTLADRSRLAYLVGYWQSFRYFEEARPHLLEDLRPSTVVDSHYADIATRIEGCQSVMVHVRRGDYVHSASAAKVHGALPLDYYRRALELVRGRVKDPHLFFFSDDIAWVREHLHTDLPSEYVANASGDTAVIAELGLMQRCHHHVIANSSLSWWGAWLADRHGQMVVAPRCWLKSESLVLDDLLPPSWETLDCGD
ncbi:alpha-1,2-fucosyltransferase [Piscinibacter gummiphilus]|uniref:Alpha-1,2-fucosyltransferase n=1 Tax=Piscinibacter gummiphilus TaxID=946333 RepID=A0ABZ0D5Z2_9BURK|nr:alpha-1,2-fucosyltransferase [Piscinibacter gummiphilus]WOB10079.1 alpha-1,2-fucosyltransferase [Piscinibacter gummiphilus]